MIGGVELPIDPDGRSAVDLDPARYEHPILIGLARQNLEVCSWNRSCLAAAVSPFGIGARARAWTCSNEEGGLCLRLLDARGGAQPRVHLRSHRRRPLRAKRRDQILQQGEFRS